LQWEDDCGGADVLGPQPLRGFRNGSLQPGQSDVGPWPAPSSSQHRQPFARPQKERKEEEKKDANK